ncbi:hypothetical protein KUTeg_008232 [Tegillarca granosa]|uniref:Vacuolar-sorting protein SNF8 n=1 Tax=Tegillarca granosa TaxID=220873 RepID=A0ABQ9F8K1_TEGGR|nr:hypothetical protein KUTeg_008232 [Tegillarca granosa]
MHRRGHGIGAIKNKNLAQARYKDKGTLLAEDQFAQMAKQMETFRGHLEEFAAKHKDDIKKDPQFRIIEVCLATSHRNGGLIGLEELRDRLVASRGKRSQDISLDDVFCAIKKLKVLGNGFTVIPVGKTYLVQSVPGELSMDHTTVLQQAQEKGYVTKTDLLTKLKWEEERAVRTMNFMVKEGLAWIDDQAKERQYWFPSFFPYNTFAA